MTEQQTWPDPELGQLATQLRQVEERAIFTHCYGHALNLAVADVVKESRMLKSSLSPGTVGFRTLCPTRWTVRAAFLQSVIKNYEVFQVFWDEARDTTSDSENRARITGVKAQMEKFEFLFGLCLVLLIVNN
ncbi:hypothetical protein EMCRGX_G010945 [Ephydatia muelleri]